MITIWLKMPVFVVSLMVLSACTALPKTTPADPEERQARLEALTEFSFSGGLGVWTDDESVSARIRWQQTENKLDVRLTGPLGIGDMQLVDSDGLATLSRAGTVITEGASVDRVLQTSLGLTAAVPVQQLKKWTIGLPGDAKSFEADSQGRLSSLRFTDEQGTRWQARFLRYTNLDGLELPSLITAKGGPYSVRLVLKNWQPTVHSVVPAQERPNTRLAIPSR